MANNTLIYNAAMAGAAGGVHSRWLVSIDTANYTAIRNQIIIFATAVDAVIPADADINEQYANLLQAICEQTLSGRWLDTLTSANVQSIGLSIKGLYDVMKVQLL